MLLVLAIVVLSAAGLVACSDDSGSSAKRTTTTTAAATTTVAATSTTVAPPTTTATAVPVAGTYLNAGTNDPHYSLALQTSNGTGIGGTLTYVFQDGTTNQVFTFSGTAGGGTANVTPSTGAAFTFTYTANQLVLANCSAFMQQAPTTCTFNLQ